MNPGRHVGYRTRRLALLLVLLAFVPGCFRKWGRPTFRRQPTCVFNENVSKDELIAHLNRYHSQVTAWRCTDASVKVPGPGGVKVPLSANLAVQYPKNIRMRAKSLRGDEADIGSNQERFWFWMRETGPRTHWFRTVP